MIMSLSEAFQAFVGSPYVAGLEAAGLAPLLFGAGLAVILVKVQRATGPRGPVKEQPAAAEPEVFRRAA